MNLAICFLVFVGATTFQTFDLMGLQYSPALFMVRQDVRKELKLTKEQLKLAERLLKDMQTAGKDSQKDPMASMRALTKANEDLTSMLDEPQKQRLTEIKWQAMGINCILDPAMKELLKLTDEQFEAANKSKSDLMNAWLQQARGGKLDQKKLDKLGKEHEERVFALLTEEQRFNYKTSLGKPFPNARPKGMPPF